MVGNAQHSTFNIQRSSKRRGGCLERWALNVQCSMFLLLLSVASVRAQSTNDLPVLAPPYGELPPSFWAQHETAIIVGGFALLAVVFLFLRVWLRPETPVIVPPEILARRTLEKLQAQPEDGKVLSEISQALRRYLAAAFNLPGGEMTTAEFCATLAADKKMDAELMQTISNFLRECDARKFSPASFVAPLNAAGRALELVSAAEVRRSRSAPASGAGMPQPQEAAAHQQTQPSADVAASEDGRTP